MKKMKKQYIAEVRFHKAYDGKWVNTWGFVDNSTRYKSTLTLAQAELEYVVKKFNSRKAGVETTYANGFGIDTIIDQESIDRMTIVETRIRCREVTDWEIVE